MKINKKLPFHYLTRTLAFGLELTYLHMDLICYTGGAFRLLEEDNKEDGEDLSSDDLTNMPYLDQVNHAMYKLRFALCTVQLGS